MNIYDAFMYPFEKRILSRIRRKIIPLAFGNVLEIGYGTGVNFKYYNPASIKSYSALDTKPESSVNVSSSFPIEFIEGQAEKLPFPDKSFETVVETLVFCSVNNLNKALEEILRVLKPGGVFIFIDHVLPEKKGVASLFKIANLIWPKITGGCNLTREPHKLIKDSGLIVEQSGNAGNSVFRWGVGRK